MTSADMIFQYYLKPQGTAQCSEPKREEKKRANVRGQVNKLLILHFKKGNKMTRLLQLL